MSHRLRDRMTWTAALVLVTFILSTSACTAPLSNISDGVYIITTSVGNLLLSNDFYSRTNAPAIATTSWKDQSRQQWEITNNIVDGSVTLRNVRSSQYLNLIYDVPYLPKEPVVMGNNKQGRWLLIESSEPGHYYITAPHRYRCVTNVSEVRDKGRTEPIFVMDLFDRYPPARTILLTKDERSQRQTWRFQRVEQVFT
ncbi:hypothetical protein BGZ51_009500 [Haplosporangium sp. Z 767]|nr:hypothetical protein BGZ51_009500 [Haplosporangium sp. Z 767]